MMDTYAKHLAAVRANGVQKHHVSGIRKLLNASARTAQGYRASATACKVDDVSVALLESEIARVRPHVLGPLYESGLIVLRHPRHAKKLKAVAEIIPQIDQIRLIRFEYIGDAKHVPVYLAMADLGRKRFAFRNVPWQSGGNGPEIVPEFEDR